MAVENPAELLSFLNSLPSADAVRAELEKRAGGRFKTIFPDEGPYRRELYAKHLEFFRLGSIHRERLFLKANRVGGPQPHDEPVLTPNGFVPMGSLSVGDEVIAGDGSATKVEAVFDQGEQQVYKFTFSDGSWTRCTADHHWSVRPIRLGHSKNGRPTQHRLMSTSELMSEIAAGRRFALPPRPIATLSPRTSLPVDPYLLGLLLGDGYIAGDETSITSVDQEIVDYCRRIAPQYGCELHGGERGSITYNFSTTLKRGGRWFNLLSDMLRNLGVRVLGEVKRVPLQYLLAGEEDRRSVLAGLMDTDGWCGKANGARQFYSASQGLCEDVAWLARSLGIEASIRMKYGAQPEKHLVSCWIAHLSVSNDTVFRLTRKREREKKPVSQRGVLIESIVADGSDECRCIRVEHPEHLYLTRGFIPTHNTRAGAYETTCHATGRYPHWWEGRRFKQKTDIWVVGETAETTRDILQLELLGPPGQPHMQGTGMLPADSIYHKTAGKVTDSVGQLYVRHVTGDISTIGFKSFSEGRQNFQGTQKNLVWLDEECPDDVYEECMLRTMETDPFSQGAFEGGILMLTFTPLQGLTPLVVSFLEDRALDEVRQENLDARG